jgi:hypothetical protein
MEQHHATEDVQVARGMNLVQRYKYRRLRSVYECLELQQWLKAAYLDNPAVEDDQRNNARLIYAGVEAVRLDLEHRHVSGA